MYVFRKDAGVLFAVVRDPSGYGSIRRINLSGGDRYIWNYGGIISGVVTAITGSTNLNSPSVYYTWVPCKSFCPFVRVYFITFVIRG